MDIDTIEALFAREWAVISSAPFLFAAALVVVVSIIWLVNWRLHVLIYGQRIALLNDRLIQKDDHIKFLEKQLEIGREQQKVVESAETPEEDDLEPKLKSLINGRPSVLQAFFELTDKGSMQLRWDPFGGSPQWEAQTPPTENEIEKMAAVQFLSDRGFISSVIDVGVADFTVVASDEAIALRADYEAFLKKN